MIVYFKSKRSSDEKLFSGKLLHIGSSHWRLSHKIWKLSYEIEDVLVKSCPNVWDHCEKYTTRHLSTPSLFSFPRFIYVCSCECSAPPIELLPTPTKQPIPAQLVGLSLPLFNSDDQLAHQTVRPTEPRARECVPVP